MNYVQKAKHVSKFSGLTGVMLISFPGNGVFFSLYEGIKVTLARALPSWNPSIFHLCASSIAELVFIAMRSPAEVVKQNMMIGVFKTS